MENNKKLNPNSHECLSSWSELPLDLLNMVFKRLGFFYFHRARSVCSSWLSASKQSIPKDNHTPWLILFPEEQKNSHCKLFNPEEKERLYKTQDTRLDFSKSVCKATYGTWLLMQNRYYSLYIVNLFTNEIITLYLPPIDQSRLRMTKVVDEEWKHNGINDRIVSTVLWIDDKTKDYVVLCNVDNSHVVYYSKKLYGYWKEIPETSKCYDMVYNDHRLYLLNYHGVFSIFDFRGGTPQQTVQRVLKVVSVYNHQISSRLSIVATKLVATVAGDVLVVQKMWRPVSRTWSFLVIKVYSSGNLMEHHQLVSSLGNESVLFDQGITVLASETYGFIANSIYFSGEKDTKDIYSFNLKRNKMELVHRFDCSSVQFSGARWFLPSFCTC